MRSSLVLALAAAASTLAAQDEPAPATAAVLPKLRAAFAAAQECEYAAVVAVVQGHEPVVLTAGTDSSGKDLTPQTLVPLLTLAKVLAADAIHVRLKDKIDEGCGEKLGARELTVRELLDGIPLLPDFFVLDGGDDAVDAALLKKCGAMAAGGDMGPQASRLGAAEFVLLEPVALGEHHQDWPSMLRSTLAPRVPGFDPLGADALGDVERRTILTAEDLAKLAKAQPAVLRTLLSLRDIGTWMQWRTQHDAPLWASARMGAMVASRVRPNVQFWVTGSHAMQTSVWLTQYPSRKAALLRIVAHESPNLMHQLQLAFEEDLHSDEAEHGASQQERLQAARATALAGLGNQASTAPSKLAGTHWCSTTADGEETARLAFGATLEAPLRLTLRGESMAFRMKQTGAGLRATPLRRGTDMFWLWIRPDPDFENATKVACVLVAGRISDAQSAASTTTASVPHYFELLPQKD